MVPLDTFLYVRLCKVPVLINKFLSVCPYRVRRSSRNRLIVVISTAASALDFSGKNQSEGEHIDRLNCSLITDISIYLRSG